MTRKTVLLIFLIILLSLVAVYYYFINSSQNINLNNLEKGCKIHAYCGNFVGVNCGAEVDGPYYYVKKDTGRIISSCGGYCMKGRCNDCPPKEWSCPTY